MRATRAAARAAAMQRVRRAAPATVHVNTASSVHALAVTPAGMGTQKRTARPSAVHMSAFLSRKPVGLRVCV